MKIAAIGEKGSLLQGKDGRLKAVVTVNGKQFQKRVKSEEEARQYVLSVELERDNRDELSAKQLNDASNALHFLKQHKIEVTFTELARFYADNAFQGVVTVEEAANRFLDFMKSRLAEGTFAHYKRSIDKFVEKFADRKVASFRRTDLSSYLSQFETKYGAWQNNHIALSKFFSLCLKWDYTTSNPCSLIEGPKQTTQPKREFLTVEDTKKLLEALEKEPKKELLFYAVLGLFGGLRPIESYRLRLEHINLKTRYIQIGSDITKSHTFKERLVPICDTLYAYLKEFENDLPSLMSKKSTSQINVILAKFGRVCKKAGLKKSKDVFRHSFGTYRVALTGNSAETASIMGHAERVGLRYYRGKVTKEDAIKYFSIMPHGSAVTDLDDL